MSTSRVQVAPRKNCKMVDVWKGILVLKIMQKQAMEHNAIVGPIRTYPAHAKHRTRTSNDDEDDNRLLLLSCPNTTECRPVFKGIPALTIAILSLSWALDFRIYIMQCIPLYLFKTLDNYLREIWLLSLTKNMMTYLLSSRSNSYREEA